MSVQNQIGKSEFRNKLQALVTTPYIPKKADDALREAGLSGKFGKNAFKSATKREVVQAFKVLQDKGVVNKRRSANQLYIDLLQEQSEQKVHPYTGVGLNTAKLPQKLDLRNFRKYIGKILPGKEAHLETVFQEWGMKGENKVLSKTQMTRVLERLREEGLISKGGIGSEIAKHELQRKAFIKEGIEKENEEEDLISGGRYSRRALPKGVKSSAAGEAVTSVSRLGEKATPTNSGPVTSISRRNITTKEDNDKIISASKFQKKKEGDNKTTGGRPNSLPDILAA
jgi:hypothetical protein